MELATDAPAVREAWSRIEWWLDRHAPGVRAELRTAVPEAEWADLERSVGLPLPVEVKESWRLHDGTSPGRSLLHGRELLTARGMRLLWQRLCRRGGGPGGWNPSYLPFAADGLGDFLCLDLTPGSAPFGRVVEYWPDRGHVLVVASSFCEWLEGLAHEVESAPLPETRLPGIRLSRSGSAAPDRRKSPRGGCEADGVGGAGGVGGQGRLNGTVPGHEVRQAEDLLGLLAHRDLLVLTPGADLRGLAEAVEPMLLDVAPAPVRAEALVDLLLEHPAVDELFVDDETLAAILDAW